MGFLLLIIFNGERLHLMGILQAASQLAVEIVMSMFLQN